MKRMKKMKNISAVLLALTLCVALASCGKGENKDNADAASGTAVSSAVESAASTQTNLERLVSADTFQRQVQAMSASYESQGLKLDVTAKGNSMIYTISYTIDLEDTDATRDKVEEYLNGSSMTSSFQSILKSVQVTVPEAESIIVRYVDKQGNEIVSKEYR